MKPLTILMLEDSAIDAHVIEQYLRRSGVQCRMKVCATAEQYIDLLEHNKFDIILSDHQLPNFDSLQALHVRNQKHSATPFILITGAISEELAIAILQQGADDYILKDRLQRLSTAIKTVIKRYTEAEEKKSIEKSLAILTERLQLASKASLDIIWDYDLKTKAIYCSEAVERITGHSSNENLSLSFLKTFIHPEDLDAVEASFNQMLFQKANRWRKIFRAIRSDGEIVFMNSNALVLRNERNRAYRVVGVMQDVTELRRLQHEMVEKEVKKQKQLADVTIQAQEKERSEISKELHDNVNQLLATAKIMIDTARSVPEIHDLCLQKSQEVILSAIKEIRHISHAMMPPSFEKQQFDELVKDLVDTLRLSGQLELLVQLPSRDVLLSMPAFLKLSFYRIIQEQLANILKYAKAKSVFINLIQSEGRLILTIQDDGIGFNLSKPSDGIGLKNIESRSELLHGFSKIITAPGKGCTITVQVPFEEEAVI